MANVHLPVLDEPELPSASLPSDGRRRAIQPADVHGRFARARRVAAIVMIGVWVALPWVTIGGHPAVFLDVQRRQFFLFGATFNAQDTWLLFFLLTGVGFSLVYATALAGRVWCGWACPQTVFLEGVYRRIERWLEGPRERRIRRDAGPWNAEKLLRKGAVQTLYALVSVVIAHVFLAYFVSLPRTLEMVRHTPAAHPEAFVWSVAMSAVFYLNFAWFREQLCVVLCPYGRLQSSLLDDHSLVIGYDVRRGEPRGKKGAPGAGDCVDCKRCVVVCPTGIDIRNGVQMECIACTACIDACDDVMTKLGRPRGLVRYDTPDGLAGRPRRIVRPRLVLYSALLGLGAVVALIATNHRADFEATLLRLPGDPYVLDGDQVRNALQVHLVNKRSTTETFRIEVVADPAMTAVVPVPQVEVRSLADARVPIFVSMPRGASHAGLSVGVRVVRAGDPRDALRVTGAFLGPSR